VSRHGQASAEDRLCNQQLGILAGYMTTNVLRASGHDLVDVSHHVSRSEYLGNQKVHQADISCIAKAACVPAGAATGSGHAMGKKWGG